jgi:hypothetical protein
MYEKESRMLDILAMNDAEGEVRALLRTLKRPFALKRNQLARSLQEAYRAPDALAAIVAAIREACSQAPAYGPIFQEIIGRCDLRAEPTKHAAAEMSMSARTFFRFRKDAIATVTHGIERKLRDTICS